MLDFSNNMDDLQVAIEMLSQTGSGQYGQYSEGFLNRFQSISTAAILIVQAEMQDVGFLKHYGDLHIVVG